MFRNALWLLGTAWIATAAAPAAPRSSEPPRDDLALLALDRIHDGRFEAARSLLGPAATANADPALHFLLAFTDYWTLLYDSEDPAVRGRFERRIEDAVLAAESARARGVAGAEVWAGTSRLLLAQYRVIDKHHLSAAREAGRAKRILEHAADGAQRTEALFGLGTYNYMADRVSAFVKGLRAILFLPGGNRERGLEQLAEAASRSRHFSLDARLLLATIHASRKERRFDLATVEMERALAAAPEAIVVLHAAARLDLSLARPESASARLDRALARASEGSPVHPAVRATLELLRARAEFALFRTESALDRLAPLLSPGRRIPAAVREDVEALAGDAREVLARPEWGRVANLLDPAGDSRTAAERAVRLAETAPDDSVMAFAAGAALLRNRDPGGALDWLSRAERGSDSLPRGWIGPCRLLAGRAADLHGDRDLAIGFYRRATESPFFIGRDAAFQGILTPFRGDS